ncbi:MAG: hypothetical protein GF344_12785 [Chitinivibrionales bacterium]|nr:hypothetical protein [Chitinivibrionales bacterium]MBD3357619.1 hypothetical protein [Chitinivibrionales bacterium]
MIKKLWRKRGEGKSRINEEHKESKADEVEELYWRALRGLMQQIHRRTQFEGARVFAFMGLLPAQGTTSVLDDLVTLLRLASGRQRVLLVDANSANPTLDAKFGVQAGPGLYQVVRSTCPLKEAVYRVNNANNLWILPNRWPNEENNAFLSHDEVEALLSACREAFDTVLIDAPPLSVIGDSPPLQRLVDVNYIVVSSGSVHAKVAEKMLRSIRNDGGRIGGIILNRFAQVIPRWLY